MPTKTNSELIAPQPIITVKEAKKLLGVASRNIPDYEIERFIVLLEEIASLRLATLEKYTLDKITEKDKTAQLAKIDAKLEDLGDDKKDADEYVKDKEQIIDEAMQLIDQPDEFWNQASPKVQKAIQWLVFPNGLEYDFGTGFGTSPLSQTHLLIQELNKNYLKMQVWYTRTLHRWKTRIS